MKHCDCPPSFVIVAGPNGSGKTTFVKSHLSSIYSQHQILNYDEIVKAKNISNPISISAGKELRKRFETCQSNLKSFIYETTLSDSTDFLINSISEMQNANWEVILYFLWISSYEVSLKRVAQRVASGGHDVDKKHIIARYQRSVRNVIERYLPICNTVLCFDNECKDPRVIFSKKDEIVSIFNESLYNVMLEQ
ncbi:MAG: zeta toxin family protein [Caldisericia bacterium]|nr:zeta toxin family protein [Caldisericia bacterium]